MINYFRKFNNKNLILFVHGFMGGNKTWSEEGITKIPESLLKDSRITDNFDMAHFNYYTQLSSKLERAKYLFGLLPFGQARKFKKNLSISDIKDILFSHLEQSFKEYDNVIIVAHSMGGLIAKAAILKLIEEENNKVSLFVSLAVPHNGSKIADFAKLVLRLSNPNVKDLAPLSELIDQVNRKWIDSTIIDALPETIYYQGKNDFVVPKESSEGYDSRKVKVVYSDDDHSSILAPTSEDALVITSIRDSILDTLKKKATPQARLIQADISENSLDELTDKIGQKLGLNQLVFNSKSFQKDSMPQASSHRSLRVEIIAELLESQPQWLHLVGMHSTGKTQLALLLQAHLDLATTWISLEEVDEKGLILKIHNSFGVNSAEEFDTYISSLPSGNKMVVVLDDLPKFGISSSRDQQFNAFISACSKAGVYVLSTSNFKLSPSIISVHGDNLQESPVPLLNRDEVNEVLSTYPDSSAFAFKDLIYDITDGHPVYLQVVCRFLQNRNWEIQEDELINFFKGTIFTDLTDDTLAKFVSNVEDGQTRELLYRLNVIKSAISDNEIAIVSTCLPEVDRPHEKISTVLGIWMQREADKYLVSPLFRRLGTHNLSQKVRKDVNYALGSSLLGKGILSQYDVRYILSYFTDAEAFEVAGYVALNLLKYSYKNPDYYYDSHLELYTWYYSSIPVQTPLLLRLLIRSLQLSLASERTPEEVDFLRRDLVVLVEQALEEKVDVYLPSLILSSSYLREDGALAVKYFSYYINSPAYSSHPENSLPKLAELSQFDNNIIWLLLSNINSIETIDEWFESARILTNPISEDTEQAYILSNQLFLNILKREQLLDAPDWDRAISTIRHIYKRASELSMHTLKAMSLKTMLLILAEKQGNIEAAEDAYLSFKEEISDTTGDFHVRGELGRQFYLKNNTEKAKEYLLPVADFPAEKYMTVKADTLQTLSLVVAATDTHTAHEYMEKVMHFITDNIFIDEISYVHFVGEYAISLFLSGDIHGAMERLVEGYKILVVSFESSELYINAQVKYGNIIGYILNLVEKGVPPGEGYTKPYRGMISRYANLQDLFFAEKINIVIFHIIRYYEAVNNLPEAREWVKKLFRLIQVYGLKVFHRMLSVHLGYFIMDGNYKEALNQQIDIMHKTNQMIESDTSTIANEYERTSAKSIQSAEANLTVVGDFDLYLFAVNPILYHLLNRFLNEELSRSEVVETLTSILQEYQSIFRNDAALNHVQYILENFPENHAKAEEILKYTTSVDPESFGLVQILSYLICSLQASSKKALDIHFKLSAYFPLYMANSNQSIITDFFYTFWSKRLDKDPKSFKNLRKLEENFKKVLDLPVNHQLPAIFALIADSLDYTITEAEQSWLQKYYDIYGE